MSETRLQLFCPLPLQVIWHENKTTYLSIRKERKVLHMRIHRLFYDAPTPVLEALIRYALKPHDKEACAIVRQMAHLHFSRNTIEPPKKLISRGKIYDLQQIFDRLLLLVPIADVVIGWSDRPRVGKFRSMTFGTFDRHCRQIRINPLLDDPQVPLYFLEFIVYHEMLHALCPSKMDAEGRCFVHTPEFRKKEKLFPQYKAAKEWEKNSLMFFKKRKGSHGRS